MPQPHLIRGTIHSPFFIFVECAFKYSDEELLAKLGITGFARDDQLGSTMSCLYVTEDARWVHIADDWYYSLWHSPTIRDSIAELAETHDIYACSVGDSDQSFDFVLHTGSRLVRKYVVTDPHYRGGTVVENYGRALAGEKEALSLPDNMDKVLYLASLLGIDVRHDDKVIRTFTRPRRGFITDRPGA